jgi:hypothetical protein
MRDELALLLPVTFSISALAINGIHNKTRKAKINRPLPEG